MTNLNWGILGSGWIAQEMGEALQAVNGSIYGIYSANPAQLPLLHVCRCRRHAK